jgi:hypothetical protein
MEYIFEEYAKKVELRTELFHYYWLAKKYKKKMRYALPNSKSKMYTEQELYSMLTKASGEIIEMKKKIRRMFKSEEKSLSFEEKKRRDYEKKNN